MTDEFLPDVAAAPGWIPSGDAVVQASSRDSGIALSPSTAELMQLFGFGYDDVTGQGTITERKALTLSAFWSGITLICQAMAVLPVHVYKPTKSGSWEHQDQHPVNWCFNQTPNGWMTPSTSKSQIQSHLLFSGNSVNTIVRNQRGQGIGYKNYLPVNTKFYINEDDTPSYGLRDYPLADSENIIYSRGSRSPSYLEFNADEVLHFKAFSINGYTGLSVLQQARNSLGLGLTVEQFGQKFFTKGRPAGFLTKDSRLSDTAKEKMKEEWRMFQEGIRNAFNIGILSGGWKWESMGYTNDDAQFLQTREFQVLEIARWLHIPPHMLGELSKATNSNIESLMLEFILYTMMPWTVSWEEEINLKMFTPKEQAMGFKAVLDVNAWLRGDAKTKSDIDEKNIRNGVQTLDEIRNRDYLPEYPDELGKGPLIIASQLDTLKNVINGTSKLHGTDPKVKPTTGA